MNTTPCAASSIFCLSRLFIGLMQRFASNPFLFELGLIDRHTFSSWLFYMPKLLKFKINIALLCTSDNMASSLFPSFFYLLAAHEILFNPTPLLLEFKLVILGPVNLKHTHIIPGCLAPKWHHDTQGCSCVGVCSSEEWHFEQFWHTRTKHWNPAVGEQNSKSGDHIF